MPHPEKVPALLQVFATESFVYHGEMLRNHNHLLGSIDGVDGIKTDLPAPQASIW
jgi:D-alanyl-D-alanine carboxypeptidase